jgi:hypothetical protein
MYADPQSITFDTVATDLARLPSPNPEKKGVFGTQDGLKSFQVTQNKTSNRFRREVRLSFTKVAADPISGANKEVSSSVIFIIDEPRWGISDAELTTDTTALVDWIGAGDNLSDLLGGEI